MTHHYPGDDGRMDFYDQSDEQLYARVSELRAKAQAGIVQAKAAGPKTAAGIKAREDAGHALDLAKSMDAELKARPGRRAEAGAGEVRSYDATAGTIGGPVAGAKSGRTRLTAEGLREAASAAVTTGFTAGGQKALSLTDATAVAVVAPGLKPLGRPTSVLDVVELQATATPTFKFLRQASRTNRAAVVAKGAVKPQSDYGIDTVARELQIIAHLSDGIAEYDLSDVADLTTFLQAELEYGLRLAVESELFNGTGAAGELHGLAGESGVQLQPFVSDILTTTRKALTAIESLGYTGGVFVVSPTVLEEIDLAVTGGSGEFQNVRAPFNRAEYRLWGVPIVPSTQLPAGAAYLLGAESVLVYSDPGAAIRVQWDRVNDDFTRNQIRARVEGRFEVAVTRPEAIVRLATTA